MKAKRMRAALISWNDETGEFKLISGDRKVADKLIEAAVHQINPTQYKSLRLSLARHPLVK